MAMTKRELIQFMDELVELASEGYCFPCMKEILGLIKKPIVIEQEEKKDG